MTKEIIECIRKVVVPFVKKKLVEINRQGLGESDAKEFDEHMNEILDLATKALGQKSCSDVPDISVRKCEDAISRADAIKCGLTDADTDKYAVQVQNGEGYYNSDGRYVSYDLD